MLQFIYFLYFLPAFQSFSVQNTEIIFKQDLATFFTLLVQEL